MKRKFKKNRTTLPLAASLALLASAGMTLAQTTLSSEDWEGGLGNGVIPGFAGSPSTQWDDNGQNNALSDQAGSDGTGGNSGKAVRVRSSTGGMDLGVPLLLTTGTYTQATISFDLKPNSNGYDTDLEYSANGLFTDQVLLANYNGGTGFYTTLGQWYLNQSVTVVDGVGGIVFTDTAKYRFRSNGGGANSTSNTFDNLLVTAKVSDVTPPTLAAADIVESTGSPVWIVGAPLSYTVTFDEPMDASTVDVADFGKSAASTATITVDSVTPTGNEAQFVVVVTPTVAGTLELELLAGASVSDIALNAATALPVTDADLITIGAGTGAVTLDTVAAVGSQNDTWNQSTNWDPEIVPTGGLAAIVDTGLTVRIGDDSTPTYSGGLTLNAGSTMEFGFMGSSQNYDGSANALGTGAITMNTGSSIQWRLKAAPTLPDLVMNGDASFVMDSNESHSRDISLTGISGSGQLTFLSTNNNDHRFLETNPSWSGGFVGGVSSSTNTRFYGDATGCFGTGDVTISTTGADLEINSADAIDDGAKLTLIGGGRNGSAIKLQMDADDTVNLLTIDGVDYPAGTYARVGVAADYNLSLMNGNKVLTVLTTPPSATLPTLVSITDNAGGGSIVVGSTPTYTVTFDKVMDLATIDASDFEDGGDSNATIGSVGYTPGNPFSVDVQATPANAGTLVLQIVLDSVLADTVVPANLLATNPQLPGSAGNVVNVVPDIEGQFGVLDPSVFAANFGQNPATGETWQAGDNYRLVFVSSTLTGDATSTDIATYNAKVDALATAAGYGAADWFAIASTATVDARDNTGTNPGSGTGVSIYLMNGSQIIADNNADLWDSVIATNIDLDEYGAAFRLDTPWGGHGSVWTGSKPDGTGNAELGDGGSPTFGLASQHTSQHWINRGGEAEASTNLMLYGLSDLLTIQTIGGASAFDGWAATGTLPGTVTFEGDLNADGVQDGIAFLLGVTNPDNDANGNLPVVTDDGSGGLIMTFDCLNTAARGTSVLNIEYSNDLGTWVPTAVPGGAGNSTVGSVDFVATEPGLVHVIATIDSSEAAAGKLFGRLKGEE